MSSFSTRASLTPKFHDLRPCLAFARYIYMYIADTFDISRFMESRSTMNRRRGGRGAEGLVWNMSRTFPGGGVGRRWNTGKCRGLPVSKLLNQLYIKREANALIFLRQVLLDTYMWWRRRDGHPSAKRKKIFPIYFHLLVDCLHTASISSTTEQTKFIRILEWFKSFPAHSRPTYLDEVIRSRSGPVNKTFLQPEHQISQSIKRHSVSWGISSLAQNNFIYSYR